MPAMTAAGVAEQLEVLGHETQVLERAQDDAVVGEDDLP